ncbi:MAG: DMT family transporter [Ilumatobacter sp.]|nr:DMT family transporter [Ilumatobacter sp.]
MPVLLALGSALVYGVSDYVGGRASRLRPPVVIALLAEGALLLVTVAAVPLIEADGPTAAAIWWGVGGGLAGATGVLGLYAALARGNMTVVAPVTGIVAAIVPVGVGVALGERPGLLAAAGIALAVVAVALIGGIAGVGDQPVERSTIVLSALVGAAFGMLFVAYSRTGDDSGTWPLLTARAGGTPLLLIAFVLFRRRDRTISIDRSAVPVGGVIGVLILVANGLYLWSTHDGLLSIVAVLVALYPVSTVVLAAVLDRERPSASQVLGMATAAIAVAMITIGA